MKGATTIITLVLIASIAGRTEVNPHFPGFWCQNKAAAIQNGAAVAIAAKDLASVGLRFVQSQAAYEAAKTELWSFAAFGLLSAMSNNLWLVPIAGALMAVQVGNMVRNAQSCHMCAKQLDEDLIQTLLALGYSGSNSLTALISALSEASIPTDSIANYIPSFYKNV